MTQSLDAYNAGVEPAQTQEGRLATRSAFGSQLAPGAWADAEARAGLA